MKLFTRIALGFLCTAAGAQTFDTRILKEGNVWVYRHGNSSGSSQTLRAASYWGMRTFRLKNLRVSGNSTLFEVVEADTGQTVNSRMILVEPWWERTDTSYTRTEKISSFSFENNSFAPAIPFFAARTNFTDTAERVVYQGDTLRHRTYTSTGFTCAASGESIENLGNVYDRTTSCVGHTTGYTEFQLLSFNNQPYQPDSVHAVGILRPHRNFVRATPTLWVDKDRVVLNKGGRLYDLRGQQIRVPTAQKPSAP
jgi:hypothetical protein